MIDCVVDRGRLCSPIDHAAGASFKIGGDYPSVDRGFAKSPLGGRASN
jgi:hypothetical protein